MTKTTQGIYIVPLQQLFKGLCGHATIFHFLTVPHYCYGFCQLSGWGTAGPWYPPQPCRDPSQNLITTRIVFIVKEIAYPTTASQIEQWILCAEALTQLSQHPNSAFSSRWPQNMDTEGEVCSLRTSSTCHTVSIQGISISPYDRDNTGGNKTLELRRKWPWKTFLLILPYIH